MSPTDDQPVQPKVESHNSEDVPDSPIGADADVGSDQVAEESEVQTIRLDHFLQVCGVMTGGQAKRLIQDGFVLLNGEVETRRRKKLVLGDVVSIDGEVFEVSLDDEGPIE